MNMTIKVVFLASLCVAGLGAGIMDDAGYKCGEYAGMTMVIGFGLSLFFSLYSRGDCSYLEELMAICSFFNLIAIVQLFFTDTPLLIWAGDQFFIWLNNGDPLPEHLRPI